MTTQRFSYYALAVVLLLTATLSIPRALDAGQASLVSATVHPNPFTSGTTFELTMPREGDVKIVVYNIRGEAVKILLDGYKPKGVYDVPWNGRDEAGQPVVPGVYVCVLFAGNTTIKSVKVVKAHG